MMQQSRKPKVALITPYLAASNNGNWHTAARWARHLAPVCRVDLAQSWNGRAADLMIALHARRSAESIRSFAAAHPDRALIVVLTGTDLYRDIGVSREARRSLALATRLVVLNERGPQRLPRAARAKAEVILQSARALKPGHPPKRHFAIAVVGHLRSEKNPQFLWALLRNLPKDLPVLIRHVGGALDPALGREAARVAAADRRYRWLGELPRPRARQLIRGSHVLLHPSSMEGGAQAVIEAVTAQTAVIGSGIDGNAGLLGNDYPGLFTENDVEAAVALIIRAAHQPAFLQLLRERCAQRMPLFAPERERESVRRLVDNCLKTMSRNLR